MMSSGASSVLDTPKSPETGFWLRAGELSDVALPNPMTENPRKMFATKSDGPVFETLCRNV